MPGPDASRPGDVVRALNGKAVDIINTDAEGRLILGDAMTYAERLGATHVVDVATLTGAVARAFGHLVTGAFGDAAGLVRRGRGRGRARRRALLAAPPGRGVLAGDGELDRRHGEHGLDPEAGLIKSALFLRQFVTVPWVHLDIAGTAYFRKATPWAPRGATGVAHGDARRARAGGRALSGRPVGAPGPR